MLLSGLCVVHCIGGLVLVAGMGLGGMFLLDPAFHRVGLAAAAVIAAFSIGIGALRHRRFAPSIVACVGLGFMTGGLLVPHGPQEALFTVIGVVLVAAGHVLNLRRAKEPLSRADDDCCACPHP